LDNVILNPLMFLVEMLEAKELEDKLSASGDRNGSLQKAYEFANLVFPTISSAIIKLVQAGALRVDLSIGDCFDDLRSFSGLDTPKLQAGL
jgi:hypothetical protein